MSKDRRRLRWLIPRRWRWALVRLTVVAVLILVFRVHLLTWLTAGHNWAWKTITGSTENHAGNVARLKRLGGPGVRMLIRIGQARGLSNVRDPDAVPALLDVARSHEDTRTRVFALRGLERFDDPRIVPLALRLLADPDAGVRAAAADTVAQLGDQSHRAELAKALAEETDGWVRRCLGWALKRIPPPPGAPAAAGPAVKVAAIQFISEFGRPAENRRRLEPFIREAARNGAKLIVVPETAITGYMTHDIRTTWSLEGWPITNGLKGVSPANVAEPVPGPSTKAWCALADGLNVYLTIPFVERGPGGKYFNTVALAGPGGKLLLHYRKRNPWPFAEQSWATRGGRGLQTLDTPYGRVALLICFDINFEPPNLNRLGVDILLYPIAWVDDEGSAWYTASLPRIARRNGLHIVGANWTVPAKPKWHGYGQSEIIGRTGRILARVSDDLAEEIIYAELPIPQR